MANYGTLEYWNRRYQHKDEHYEWYTSYSSIRHLLSPPLLSPADGVHSSRARRTIEVRDRFGNLVPRSVLDLSRRAPATSGLPFPTRDQCRVLIVGCGNSRLGEDMIKDGWTGGIVNLDFSSTVIEQMNHRYNQEFYDELGGRDSKSEELSITVNPMEFVCADVTRSIPYPDASFDLVIIKGTMDSILCSSGSVANARRMMYECSRVLHDKHGAMVVVTFGNSDSRLVFFENPGDEWWAGIGVHTIPRPPEKVQEAEASKDYYVYIARKRSGCDKSSGDGQANSDAKTETETENSTPDKAPAQLSSELSESKSLSVETSSLATSVSAPSADAVHTKFTTMLR